MLTIKEASEFLGVSIPTMRRWESEGKITSYRTTGKHRRYNKKGLNEEVLSVITVFSSKLYGSRSHKLKKIKDVNIALFNDKDIEETTIVEA